jgi:hypothetical protein
LIFSFDVTACLRRGKQAEINEDYEKFIQKKPFRFLVIFFCKVLSDELSNILVTHRRISSVRY